MYKIEKKDYGFKLTFADMIHSDEMKKWVGEVKTNVATAPSKFGVFVDMRTLKPLPSDAQQLLEDGQKLFKEKGMEKSVVILNSTVIKMQFMRLAKDTGIYQWERYVDASKESNWEQVGINWISKGIDPDK